MKKSFVITLISLPLLFVLWVVGIFNNMPWIPEIKTDYYIDDISYDWDVPLLENNGDELTLRIEEGYKGEDMIVELAMYPDKGNHSLTVNHSNVIALKEDGSEASRKYFYVYTSAGEMEGMGKLVNYPFGITDSDSTSTYASLRYVFEMNQPKDFTLKIDIDYTYDNQSRRYQQTLEVERKTKLLWHELKFGKF